MGECIGCDSDEECCTGPDEQLSRAELEALQRVRIQERLRRDREERAKKDAEISECFAEQHQLAPALELLSRCDVAHEQRREMGERYAVLTQRIISLMK